MAKIIFKVVKVIVKAIILAILFCLAVGAGQITWTGIKNTWIEYCESIKPIMDKYI